MTRKPKKTIAVIGDLIDSKQIEDRFRFQQQFARDLKRIGLTRTESPYTLTLGDEFQALYTKANGLFYDLFHIRECLYPVRCRFSIALGEITTPINRKQAIGMDGPAFHEARWGIEQMKKESYPLGVRGLPDELGDFLHSAIKILWASTSGWNPNRMKILRMLYDQMRSSPESYGLKISERAINKNTRDAQLDDWVQLIHSAERQLNQLLALQA